MPESRACLDLAVAEMRRRAEMLPAEVKARCAAARANANASGIHTTQLGALETMMDVLHERQDALLKQLSGSLDTAAFARLHHELLREIIGAHDVWQVFRGMFALRADPQLARALDAADLIAADCYRTCIRQAWEWNVVGPAELREPPLVCLDADASPATVSRGGRVSELGVPLAIHKAQRLPIPVVILPCDHLACVWLWSTIGHEVGHNLDQDLRLGHELAQGAGADLGAAGVPDERRRLWGLWGEEVVADAVGILLGGPGFAHALAALLRLELPAMPDLDPQAEHPHPAVRLSLLAAFLRGSDVAAWQPAAGEVALPDAARPAWATDWVADCDQIAATYLDRKLAALGNRPLRALVPHPAADAARVASLVDYLRIAFNAPDPGTAAEPFPWRLVPVAAELAARRIAADEPAALPARLEEVHVRALDFLHNIPRPNQLGGPGVSGQQRQDAVRSQARDIRFGVSYP